MGMSVTKRSRQTSRSPAADGGDGQEPNSGGSCRYWEIGEGGRVGGPPALTYISLRLALLRHPIAVHLQAWQDSELLAAGLLVSGADGVGRRRPRG
ncbi:hypothetical protein GA0074694_1187 [Micromonospora inyonensis]|uniref:Uncharacterized protein n=1 Tax=Micromonospora inyonensis TaxID=47866 RepID=A0A1C6REJ6_9ACTN|nr:hypothetical protein GA0074694_1187 [Micromonospora inyonensis]